MHPPHRHERKFYGIHVSKVTFKHLPQPLRSDIQSFETLGILFKIPPISVHLPFLVLIVIIIIV